MGIKKVSKWTRFALAVSLAFMGLTSAALILLATMISRSYLGIYSLIITAVTLQVMGGVLIVRMTWRERSRRKSSRANESARKSQRISDGFVAVVVSLTGHLATLISVIWVVIELGGIATTVSSSPSLVIYTLVGFWGISIFSESLFLWMFFTGKTSGNKNRLSRLISYQYSYWPSAIHQRPISGARPVEQNEPLAMSNVMSAFASYKPRSNRHDRRQFAGLRFAEPGYHHSPVRSGSAEPLRPGLAVDSPARGCSPRESDGSAFDYWDTSAVSDGLRQSISIDQQGALSSANGSKTRLPTIPGSRPVSPAKPLDGPFFYTDDDDSGTDMEQRLPPSPRGVQDSSKVIQSPNKPLPAIPPSVRRHDTRPNVSHQTSLDSIGSMDSRLQGSNKGKQIPSPRPAFMRSVSMASIDSFTQARSSAMTPSAHDSSEALMGDREHTDIAEAHVHPLFRASSPSPPPSASPNTVVTAAPVSLTDIPVSVMRASADRLRETRGLSIAASTRSGGTAAAPASPKLPHSPTSPTYSPHHHHQKHSSQAPLAFPLPPATGRQSRAQVRTQSSGSNSSMMMHGGGNHSGTGTPVASRSHSRTQSRSHSRAASRADSRSAIVLRGPAGDVPPTPTSPTYSLFPASPTSPTSPSSPTSPVVAIGPSGKIITKDDLIRTGNHIVCD